MPFLHFNIVNSLQKLPMQWQIQGTRGYTSPSPTISRMQIMYLHKHSIAVVLSAIFAFTRCNSLYLPKGCAHHAPYYNAYMHHLNKKSCRYGTAQMQGKWGSRVARKSLASHARVARKSRASCPRVTRESLSSHTQTTRVIINCTTIGLLYLYCYKPFVISITKEYYSVHFFLQPLPTNTRSPVIVIDWS